MDNSLLTTKLRIPVLAEKFIQDPVEARHEGVEGHIEFSRDQKAFR